MSIPLEDLRSKVSPVVHTALEVQANLLDIDKSELVRRIVTEWADKQIHTARLLIERLDGEGT
jgi:hypothetical protein